MREEIRLTIDVPDVAVTPIHWLVQCGQTTLQVQQEGSRVWTVWAADATTTHRTPEAALAAAEQHARQQERRRRAQAQVAAHLEGVDQ